MIGIEIEVAKGRLNIVLLYRSILIVCLLFLPFYIFSNENNPVPSYGEGSKTEKIDFRIPDKQKILDYKKDSRFDYSKVEQPPTASWWEVLMDLLSRLIKKGLFKATEAGVLTVVVVIALVVLITIIIIKLYGIKIRALLGKKKMDTAEIEFYSENVHEMDFDTLISTAVENKDYRLAVRFLYLQNLKFLADNLIIDWKPYKTNVSYQNEIQDRNLKVKFLDLTLIFDYVWYGDFQIGERDFDRIQRNMTELGRMITNER